MNWRIHEASTILRQPAENARRAWSERRGLCLSYRSDGLTGLGEASPLPGYSPDDVHEARDWLARSAPIHGPELLGSTDSNALFESLAGLPPGPPSARFALETCVMDVLARRAQRSYAGWLSRTTRGVPPAPATLLAIWKPDCVERALASFQRGVTTFKIKIGRDVWRELATLRELRRRLPTATLRLDANQKLAPSCMEATLAALASVRPEFVEEPCCAAELGAPRHLPCPIALDESLSSAPAAARRWIESGHVQALVLKPMLLGGVCMCLKWLALAPRTPIVWSHCLDGVIATRVYRELSHAWGADQLAPGLGPHGACELFASFVRDEAPLAGLGLTLEELR